MSRDLFKSRPLARVKALTDGDQPGTFEAIVSVFNNEDADGEVVKPGAFTATLAEGPKPIVYSHDWLSVPIGQTLEARETAEGLYVKGRLFVADDEDHAQARQVYAAMRGGALKEFSFGGRVTSETRVEKEDGSVTWELNTIDLVEYGPCLKGSNPKTHLMAVKSALKAGIVTPAEARKSLGLDEPAVENDDTTSETEAPADAPETEDDTSGPVPDVETSPAPPETDVPAPEVDVDGPQEVTPEGRALRSLLNLPADAAQADVLAALGERATHTPSLPDGGGDPQLTDDDREAVAGLLLP